MQKSPKPLAFEYGNAQEITAHPDINMMDEIALILKKHNALQRFGLVQMNQKPSLDLVMNEQCLKSERKLITTITPKTDLKPTQVLETQWRLDIPHMLKACAATCEASPEGHDRYNHAGGGQKPN